MNENSNQQSLPRLCQHIAALCSLPSRSRGKDLLKFLSSKLCNLPQGIFQGSLRFSMTP
ncbi:hypothetical protein LguiB_033491 [Lonicera macranthoides]